MFRVRNLFTNTISLVSLATFGALLIKEYLHLRPLCFFSRCTKQHIQLQAFSFGEDSGRKTQYFVAKMNQSSSVDLENSCDHLFFHDHLQYHFADSTHGVLIAAAVFSFIACPFTCFLNVIFILAVKTKRCLQTHSNVCWHL